MSDHDNYVEKRVLFVSKKINAGEILLLEK